ncbi:hypothetical protein BGW38_006028, partial [Lunasporangiospora selenospora]
MPVVDEHLSNKSYPMCFERARPERSRRRKRDGGIKTVSVNSSMECVNHECLSFLCG